ncbi:MAG: RES domain-containing protein [Rhodobacter sp.]|nr:RES domain-containing protein [Rhodobacter sp.]MCY4168606.1 RES domain-containing protein [Rhodobacter sp.]MCY4240946.1 RES domain-containing protein [Rhodobacter sp.]
MTGLSCRIQRERLGHSYEWRSKQPRGASGPGKPPPDIRPTREKAPGFRLTPETRGLSCPNGGNPYPHAIGAPTDAVNAGSHAAGRAFAKAIQADHVDGIVYSSRGTGEDVYPVFDRSTEKLASAETGKPDCWRLMRNCQGH